MALRIPRSAHNRMFGLVALACALNLSGLPAAAQALPGGATGGSPPGGSAGIGEAAGATGAGGGVSGAATGLGEGTAGAVSGLAGTPSAGVTGGASTGPMGIGTGTAAGAAGGTTAAISGTASGAVDAAGGLVSGVGGAAGGVAGSAGDVTTGALGSAGDAVAGAAGVIGGASGAVATTTAAAVGPAMAAIGGDLVTERGNLLSLPPLPERLGAVATGAQADAAAAASVGRPLDPNAFELDELGNRVLRSEVLAVTPSEQAIQGALALNFSVLRQDDLGGLGLGFTVFGAPPGMSATEALTALRNADPNGAYDYNHVFDPSADAGAMLAQAGAGSSASVARAANGIKLGLVDAGVDRTHPDLANADIVATNIAGAAESPGSAHGTALASLLVGEGAVQGVVPGAKLYAADVFGGLAKGGSADAVTRGIAWVAEQGATVINVSLAGPRNVLLKAAIDALAARGHIIVAAVGNEGPAAPVAFPAAYDNVVAVTSVNDAHQIQIDANRGPEILFAARGVDVTVATAGGGYAKATGTSFAAPLVTGRFALMVSAPDSTAAERARESLEVQAVDLGDPGRDSVFGYGYIEASSTYATAASGN